MHGRLQPQATKSRALHRAPLRDTLLTGSAIAVFALACLGYATLRAMTAYAGLRLLAAAPPAPERASVAERPALEPATPAPVQGTLTPPLPTPTAAPTQTAPQPRRSGPTNILVLGTDQREQAQGPCRTDAMIVCSIDPRSRSVTLLSIPRDLWVPLPAESGVGHAGRINTAYFYGELYGYPGGGPALAMRTVEMTLELPIHYYLRLDWSGFQRIIDEIGGIDIDVPREIIDTEYPTPDGGVMTLHIAAGPQHMDGDMALKYVRTRHSTSDWDRARRQQQVILAVRERVLDLDIPLARIPALLRILGASISTDLPLDKIYTLVQAARQAEEQNIRRAVIDETMTTPWITPDGAEVLLPRQELIRDLLAELFT